jgi:hypothetical protein
VVVDARFVARLAAQQGIHGHAEVFAGDVPERNVDRAEGAHDGRPTEMRRAIQVLPVVLDTQWILTDQIHGEFGDDLLGSFEKAPGAGLSKADNAGVGVNLDKQVPIYRLS